MAIGDQIKKAREAAGLSQVELAKMLGISKGSVGNYESGYSSPKEDILLRIMNTLNIDANFLFSGLYDSVEKSISPLVDAKKAHLTQLYDSLNGEGQTLVVDYAEHIASKPQYKAEKAVPKSEDEEEETVRVFVAAQSLERTPPGYVDMPKKDLEKIKNAPRSKKKL